MIVYTVGHSTATLEDLLAVLQEHAVEILVDVRSKPRSRLAHFDLAALQASVEEAGVRYRFVGDRLGGIPRDPRISARWRQGKLDPIIIDHLRKSEEWRDGIDELAALVRRGSVVCIMCSEADPDECHRKAVALDTAAVVDAAQITHLAVNHQAPGEVGVQEVLL
jgi:uncharacterized protein (DUF488 family)